jgi:all-trans-8'-apo-beta-carotenal 15,15'-oxygenase
MSDCSLVFGAVPKFLVDRRYVRVGIGRTRIGSETIKNPLDGDGKVESFSFHATDRVRVQSRFVETECFTLESELNRVACRGAFGTKPSVQPQFFDFKIKNAANTSLVWHAKTLLALHEGGGLPHVVSPNTLETRCQFTEHDAGSGHSAFSTGNGALDSVLRIGGKGFGAHPVNDPNTGNLVNILTQIQPKRTVLNIVEFLKDSWCVFRSKEYVVEGFSYVHSFGITAKYCVIFAPDLSIGYVPYILGLKGPAECITHNSGGTTIHVVPRGAGKAHVVKTQRCMVTHVINSYETLDNHIVIDAMVTEEFQVNGVAMINPRRFVVSTETWTCVDVETLSVAFSEFPAINPLYRGKAYCFQYFSSSGSTQPFDCWKKLDVASKRVQRTVDFKQYVTCTTAYFLEPVFCASPVAVLEDDGVLVGVVFTDVGNYLTIVDARTMDVLCVARAEYAHCLKFGLHGIII